MKIRGLIAMAILGSAISSSSPAQQPMLHRIDTLKDEEGRTFVDRKARAFLVLSKKTSEENANLIIALLLNAGLQIVGEMDR